MGSFETYSPKNINEKPNFFSETQKEFLDAQVQEMQEDALSEDDFLGKSYSVSLKPYTQEFIDSWKNRTRQENEENSVNDEIKDKKFILEPNKKISKEHRIVRQYFEALMYKKLGGPKGWIPGALIWKTSQTDDHRGIDFIAEIKNREVSIGIDVVSSESPMRIKAKLQQVKDDIVHDKLIFPIFYEPIDKEKSFFIPKVIIATEFDKTVQILKLWADNGEIIVNHPMKVKVLLELEAQLEAFAVYAKALKKRNIASMYNDTLAQVQALIGNYGDLAERYEKHIDNDEAYKMIMSFCENLKKEAETIERNSKNE